MIYITYNNGRVLQGIVLALGDRRVRVAIKDSDDAVEYRLVNQVWVSEDCEVVTIDFDARPGLMEREEELLESLFPFAAEPAPVTRVM
jgi:hypothetical protein